MTEAFSSRFYMRPIQLDDLEPLMDLLSSLDSPVTTMPRDRNYIEDRIHHSLRAFYPAIKKAGGEQYLFVLVDGGNGRLIGTSGIVSRVGGFDPFYTYRLVEETHAHKPLDISKSVSSLHLKVNHKGPAEIGSLFLHPDYRGCKLGKLLSLSRFLFLAEFSSRFTRKVIAELRGYRSGDGHIPFWEAVGRHFFEYDFDLADFFSGIGNKEFIRDLMPRHPIYLNLLPDSVQKVIGEVHPDTVPALKMLLAEGFTKTREVDIFDAGPLLSAEIKNINTVKSRVSSRISGILSDSDTMSSSAKCALLTNAGLDFRACYGRITCADNNSLIINQSAADSLKVTEQERVDWVEI